MATKTNLGAVSSLDKISTNNSLIAEVDGAIKRVSLENLMNSMSKNDGLRLHQVAWGVPLKEASASRDWGLVGSRSMFDLYCSKIGRYLVSADGTAKKLHPDNSALYADGSRVETNVTNANVMVIAPKLFYLGVDNTDGQTTAWFSSEPIGGQKIATTSDGEYICVGAYLASKEGNKLCSLPDKNIVVKTGIATHHASAQAIGVNWGLMNYDCWKWIAFMGMAYSEGPDVQSKIGMGVIGEYESADKAAKAHEILKTGETASLGDMCGKTTILAFGSDQAPTSSCHVSLFGIEDFWGFAWQAIQGIYFGKEGDSGKTGKECYIYEGNYIPDAAALRTVPNTKYYTAQRVFSSTYSTSSYNYSFDKIVGGQKLELIPSRPTASVPVRYPDMAWHLKTGQFLSVGGGCAFSTAVGLFAQHTATNECTRLAYYGKLTFSTAYNTTTAGKAPI